MARIAVTDGMSDEAVEILENAGHEVVLRHHEPEEIANGSLLGFDAVVIRSATKLPSEQISASVNDSGGIRFIGRAGVGIDNIDLDTATKHGIVVCNTPGASTKSVVELTIGHLIASTRHIATGDRKLRKGEWAKKELRGSEIGGKRLGLIGFGRISRGVAKIASAFGMEIHYRNRSRLSPEKEMGAKYHEDLKSLFSVSDVLSICCPATKETKDIINKETLEYFPTGAIITNVARGDMIDDEAMVQALVSRKIYAVGLDVYKGEPKIHPEYLKQPTAFILPHLGSATKKTRTAMADLAIDNINEFFETGTSKNKVN